MRRIINFFTGSKSTPTNNPAVSETTVEAFLDTVAINSGTETDPLGALVAHTRRCATLVSAAPHAYSPVRLAHTVAAVTAQLAQMGDVTRAHVAAYWPSRGAALADPATDHLWQAVEQLALTAGLMDVAMTTPPAHGHTTTGDPLAALVAAATECTSQVCTSEGEPAAGPAEVARAIAQTLGALEPLFAPVHHWITAYVPGRGQDLPRSALHHLAEATGRWAPISGLITHVPADPRPEHETPAEEQTTKTAPRAAALTQSSEDLWQMPETATSEPATASSAPAAVKPTRGRSRAK